MSVWPTASFKRKAEAVEDEARVDLSRIEGWAKQEGHRAYVRVKRLLEIITPVSRPGASADAVLWTALLLILPVFIMLAFGGFSYATFVVFQGPIGFPWFVVFLGGILLILSARKNASADFALAAAVFLMLGALMLLLSAAQFLSAIHVGKCHVDDANKRVAVFSLTTGARAGMGTGDGLESPCLTNSGGQNVAYAVFMSLLYLLSILGAAYGAWLAALLARLNDHEAASKTSGGPAPAPGLVAEARRLAHEAIPFLEIISARQYPSVSAVWLRIVVWVGMLIPLVVLTVGGFSYPVSALVYGVNVFGWGVALLGMALLTAGAHNTAYELLHLARVLLVFAMVLLGLQMFVLLYRFEFVADCRRDHPKGQLVIYQYRDLEAGGQYVYEVTHDCPYAKGIDNIVYMAFVVIAYLVLMVLCHRGAAAAQMIERDKRLTPRHHRQSAAEPDATADSPPQSGPYAV